MSTLRTELIRLAAEKPHLRDHLLPILTASEDEESDDGEKEGKFERGEDVPLSEMPKKLQDNAKNPPPAAAKLKEKLKNKKGSELERKLVRLAYEKPQFREQIMATLLGEKTAGKAPGGIDQKKWDAACKMLDAIAEKAGKKPDKHAYKVSDLKKAAKGDKKLLRYLEAEYIQVTE